MVACSYCILCGLPVVLYSIINESNQIENISQTKYKWLFKRLFISVFGDIIKLISNSKKEDFNMFSSSTKKDCYEIIMAFKDRYNFIETKTIKGIIIHEDCAKYFFTKCKRNFSLDMLNISPSSFIGTRINYIDYGNIKNAMQQDFNINKIKLSNNNKYDYIFNSPLSNNSNNSKKTIDNTIRQLKLRLDNKRAGPIISASLHKEGDFRFVIKNNTHSIWYIKSKKWVRLLDSKYIESIEIQYKKNPLEILFGKYKALYEVGNIKKDAIIFGYYDINKPYKIILYGVKEHIDKIKK